MRSSQKKPDNRPETGSRIGNNPGEKIRKYVDENIIDENVTRADIPELNEQAKTEAEIEEAEMAEESVAEKEKMSIADSVKTLSPGRMVMKRFFRSKLSMVGLVTLTILFIFSFVGPELKFLPFVWGETELDGSMGKTIITEKPLTYTCKNPETGELENYTAISVSVQQLTSNIEAPPSKEHLLGTDSMTYDVFSRLMYGGRISLTIGFVVVILETLLGVLLGGLAGYFGKWVDQLIMRVVDVFYCIPTLPLMLIISFMLDSMGIEDRAKLFVMMALLTLLGWAGVARLVRGQILYLREQEYMMAAEATGLPVGRKIFKHLLPNVMPQLIVTMTLGLGSIILTEATLGYLGLGLPSRYATWGNMINVVSGEHGLKYIQNYPNLWVAPGICIILAVLAFNFIGDGLRDAFDPKSKR